MVALRVYEECRNYWRARSLLEGRDRKKVAHNTYLHCHGDYITLRYHGNCIVRYEPDSTYLYHCNWETPTTKERLNIFADAHIVQRNHIWYLVDAEGKHHEFYNGIRVEDYE